METLELICTTDRSIVVTLISLGLEIVRYERHQTETGNKTLFFFDSQQAKPVIEAWKCGKKIPVDDIRLVFQSETTFNAAIHDGI